jgi:6,7-dimethyl-8-ribityllumazine synthase
MLQKIQTQAVPSGGGKFAIVASQYNAQYVDSMLEAAAAELKQGAAETPQIVRVPGAFEIPVVVAQLAAHSAWSAIICLGVVIRGETAHAQLIAESVSDALARLQVEHRLPVIHGVLLLENDAQARKRCLDPQHNRGIEAARTALAMAKVMRELA